MVLSRTMGPGRAAWARLRLLVAVSAAGLLAGGPAGAQRLFRGPEPLAVPDRATAVFLGDLDADGLPDIAVLHGLTAEVSVHLNRGDLRFEAAGSYPVGRNPLTLVAGDLDGSGLLDLFVPSGLTGLATVLLNRGGGRFEATGSEVNLGLSPRAAELVDFDGDGRLDVVVSDPESRGFAVALGDGSGGFRRLWRTPVGDNPHDLAADDFDGDGAVDVAVIHRSVRFGNLSLFPGTGDGRFEPPVHTEFLDLSTSAPRFLAPGDFDEDGLLDLAVLTDQGGILLARNAGAFRFDVVVVAGPTGRLDSFTPVFTAVDFFRDGSLDLVTRVYADLEGALRVHPGAGDGSFIEPEDTVIDARLTTLALADLDGDDVLDAVAALAAPELSVIHGTEPGRLDVRERRRLPEYRPQDVVVLDADRDGRQDLVVLSPRGLHLIRGLRGGLGRPRTTPLEGLAQRLVRADFDGDGRDEVAFTDLARGQVRLAFLGADGGVERLLEHAVRSAPRDLVAGDFDGDGLSDLAVADSGDPHLIVILGPGNEPPRRVTSIDVGGSQEALAVGDADGDGRLDLAVATPAAVELFRGDGGGGFLPGRRFESLEDVRSLVLADVDRDGAGDLVAAVHGGLVLLFSVLAPEEPRRVDVNLGVRLDSLRVRDIDGDGFVDAAGVVRGIRDLLVVARRLSRDGAGEIEVHRVGIAPRALAIADVDGDGTLDAVTAESVSRSVSILRGVPRGPPQLFRRGDSDADGRVTLTDAVALLERLFRGGRPLLCPDAADADDSGGLNVTDAIHVLLHLFQGGRAPPEPGPDACGLDPSEDELTRCEAPCI